MKYYCTIKKIDDEEITVDVKGVEIVCFCNTGCNYNIGDEVTCELAFYDDLKIEETDELKSINRIKSTYSYRIIMDPAIQTTAIQKNVNMVR